MYVSVLYACVYVHGVHVCLVPEEVRRRYGIPWGWSYRWLWPSMWVLRTKPEPSAALIARPSLRPLSHCAPFPSLSAGDLMLCSN